MKETYTETERKFLLKEVPSFVKSKPITYERHYLYSENGVELRIQRKGSYFELERKVKSSEIQRETVKVKITEEEFELLKQLSIGQIIRESYLVDTEEYELTIKVYRGKYEGLIRAEVEFKTVDKANLFEPFDWMGEEITNSALGKDSRLLGISPEEFNKLIR